MADDEPKLGADLVGSVIDGRYRIVEMIATGAMAYVYRATQSGEPPELALKVLSPYIARHKTAAARFHREAKAVSKLSHPGVVTIYGWGMDGEMPFIAMELLEGEDLFVVLERQGRLPQERAARLIISVCEALDAAHSSGVIHRDLKPENIQVLPPRRDGTEPIKLLDFGIAKLQRGGRAGDSWNDETVPQVLTKVGSAVGTPSHMAPEQARGVDVDGRADIYACGVILYEMVTGQLPFEGDNPVQVAVRQVSDPPPPPSKFLPAIHPKLETIILRCLEKQPDNRFQTAAKLRAELVHTLKELLVEDESTTKDLVASMSLVTVPRGIIDDESTATTRRPLLSDESTETTRKPIINIPPARGRRGTELMDEAVEPSTAKRVRPTIDDPDSEEDHPTVQESFDQVRLRREIIAAKERARRQGTLIVNEETPDTVATANEPADASIPQERGSDRAPASDRDPPIVDLDELGPVSDTMQTAKSVPTAVLSPSEVLLGPSAGSDAPPASGATATTEVLAAQVGSSHPVPPAPDPARPAEQRQSGARKRPPRHELESLLGKMPKQQRRSILPFFFLFLLSIVALCALWVVINGVPTPQQVERLLEQLGLD